MNKSRYTFGAAVVTGKGEILSDVKEMYKSEDKGIIPNKCAEFLKSIKNKVINEAIKDVKKIDLVSFSQGPGMPLSLHVGLNVAKELANRYNIPLVGVSHLIAHLEIGKLLTKAKDPVFILATGANTQIIFFEDKRYHIGGETLDVGLGNALDKFGRSIGLGFPCGPEIEELAKSGRYIELPYSVKGQDLVFAGIITDVINKFKKGIKKEDLCFSLQETLFAMLCEVTERAMAHSNKKEALLIGGVAANQRLVEMLNIMCKERNAKFYVVPLKYSGDNGTMIAWQGLLEYKADKKYYDNLKLENIDIKPGWRADQVEIKYK